MHKFQSIGKCKFSLLYNRKYSKEASAITIYFLVFFLKRHWDKALCMLDSKNKKMNSTKQKDSALVHKDEKNLGNVPRELDKQ